MRIRETVRMRQHRRPERAEGPGGGTRGATALGSHGGTLFELAIVSGVVAIILGLALPHINFSPNALRAETQELMGTLSTARSFATSRVTHYRVRVTSPMTYVLERGQLVGSTWTFAPERTVTLHASVQFTSPDVTATCGLVANAGRCAEFHSRGGLASVAALDLGPVFTLQDTRRGWVRQIKVWGTGLVESL